MIEKQVSTRPRHPNRRRLAVVGLAAATLLAACDQKAPPPRAPTLVRAAIVRMSEQRTSLTLTGDVQARVLADLSFRVSGRVIERRVEVGAHVDAGDLLARIDPTEQKADLDAANAAVTSAQSQLEVAKSNFGRQQTLLASGFTTRATFDQAQQALRVAEGSLETAKAQLGTAKDALAHTELRADAAGTITTRAIEVGQVAQSARAAFTLAHDGDRDAVFDVFEAAFSFKSERDKIALALVSDRTVTATGWLREIAPTIDPKNGTVRVKIAIDDPPAAMTLGSPVIATASQAPQPRIVLPWSALTAAGQSPAVWIVDPADKTVGLRTIVVESYETGTVIVASGLTPGERVVTDGSKLLSPGQTVTFTEESGS
jgi:membrane fusion protein, multidrug efflux system